MKKLLAALLCAMMLLSMAACGTNSAPTQNPDPSQSSNQSQTPDTTPAETAKEKVLHIAFHSALTSLNPYQGMNEGMGPLGLYGYQPLFYKSQYVEDTSKSLDGWLFPGIGKSYTKVDALTYDVQIFDYVYDTDGNHITADDVVFSIEECINQGNLAMQVAAIAGVEKRGDYEIRVNMSNSQAGAFSNSITAINIVSKAAFEKYNGFADATETVSTGPYVVKNFVSGATYEFVKNENYWQKDELRTIFDTANVDKVVMTTVIDGSTRAGMVESGEADWGDRIDQAQLYLFTDTSKYNLTAIPNSLTYVLSFNMGGSSVGSTSICENNQKLREAIFTAIDPNALVATVALGNGSVTGTYGNNGYPDYLEKWDSEYYFDYDPDKAKELLQEAGYSGETITLLTSTNTTWSRIGEVIQSELNDIGIDCKLYTVDDAAFVATRGSYTGWDVTIDNKASGDYVTSVFKYSFDQDAFGGKTQCGYTDEKMQELLRVCLEEETHNAETADAFHQYLKSIAISRGMYFDNYNYVSSKLVKDNPLSDKCFILFGAAEYDPALWK